MTHMDKEKDPVYSPLLDEIEKNWKKDEEFCKESLHAVEQAVLEAAMEGEDKFQRYWNRMKTVHNEYDNKVGSSLVSKMGFVRLEHLDERQKTDCDVSMQQFLKKIADAAASTSGPESDDGEAATASQYVLYQGTAGKQLKLQMTWGRVLLFWKYWMDCRKETISTFEEIRVFLKKQERQSLSEISERRPPGDAVYMYAQIVKASPKLPMQFAHAINKDFRCYKVLLRKLQEFVSLVNCKEYLRTFGVEPNDLFLNISTFQTDITARQKCDCLGLKISEDILQWERKKLSETAQMRSHCSRPLFHLIELFQKLAEDGVLCAKGIQTVIDNLNEEDVAWSAIVSDSLMSFPDFAKRVKDAVKPLREAIDSWLPKRDDAISELNEVIRILHKTTKDVAITHTVSSSVGIVGGAIAAVGLVLGPFTFGLSALVAFIGGGALAGAGALTGIGASVTEMIIDKKQMEKVTNCLKEDQYLLDGVVEQICHLDTISNAFVRCIPPDELEFFTTSMVIPQMSTETSVSSTSSRVDPKIGIHIVRLVTVSGKAMEVSLKISKMAMKCALTARRVAGLVVAHSIGAIGIALDITNLVMAGMKLGKGAKSENAGKLEEVIAKLEDEKK